MYVMLYVIFILSIVFTVLNFLGYSIPIFVTGILMSLFVVMLLMFLMIKLRKPVKVTDKAIIVDNTLHWNPTIKLPTGEEICLETDKMKLYLLYDIPDDYEGEVNLDITIHNEFEKYNWFFKLIAFQTYYPYAGVEITPAKQEIL